MPHDTDHLEAQVRDALSLGLSGFQTTNLAETRANVLGEIRRRRRRRFQAATGGLAVALALACTLPLAIGGKAMRAPRGKAAVASAPAPNRAPATAATNATCEAAGEGAVVPCGLASSAAPGSEPFATGASTGGASTGAARASTAVGSADDPLVLRVGQRVTIELPRTPARHPWQPLNPVADSLPNSHGIVTIRQAPRPGVWGLVAAHDGSIIVQFRRSGCDGGATACPALAPSWSLYVEVTS